MINNQNSEVLSDFFFDMIIFLNKLKIVENTPIKSKNQNETSMADAMWPFTDSQAPSWFSGSRTNVPTEHLYFAK